MKLAQLSVLITLAMSVAASPILELRGGGRADGVSCRKDDDCSSRHCAFPTGKCGKKPSPPPSHPHPHPQPPPPPTHDHPYPHPAPHPAPHPRPQPGPPRLMPPGVGPKPGPEPAPSPEPQPGPEPAPSPEPQPGPEPAPSPKPQPVTAPSSGVFSFLDENGKPADLLGDSARNPQSSVDGSDIDIVDTAQTWTLNAAGFLISPAGRVLTTDGNHVVAFGNTPSDYVPYKCTFDSTSSSDTAVLDCTAHPASGATSSFALCEGGEVATNEGSCRGVATRFDHLVLGPDRVVTPPTSGLLSYVSQISDPQLLGEVFGGGFSDNVGLLEIVTSSQTWTLNSNGNLVSPTGKILNTSGFGVTDSDPTSTNYPAYTYVCTSTSSSTASQNVLTCSAVGYLGNSHTFTRCADKTIETGTPVDACDVVEQFTEFTLTSRSSRL